MNIGKLVNFEIKNINKSLEWIRQNEPDSIFATQLFAKLKEWHERYEFSCSIYSGKCDKGAFLPDRYMEELNAASAWMKVIFEYKNTESEDVAGKTDISSDTVLFEKNEAQWLAYTQKKKAETKKATNILFSEDEFEKNVEKIESYLIGLRNIYLPLYIDTAAVVGDVMYFSACNSDAFYALNLQNSHVTQLGRMAGCIHNRVKFSGTGVYKDEVWFIPFLENYIYIYNITKNAIMKLPIPMINKVERETVKFRKPVQQGNILWLLSCRGNAIVRVNMEERTYKVYNNWPRDMYFPDDSKCDFKMMFAKETELFLFRDDGSHNIIFDMLTGEMRVWNIEASGCFGILFENKVYLSPKKGEKMLHIFSYNDVTEQCNLMEREYNISSEIVDNCLIYSYWYTEVLDGKVFFLPHEADRIVVYDTKKEGFLECTCEINREHVLHNERGYGASAVCRYKDQYVMVPYMRNKVVILCCSGEKKEIEVTCPAFEIVDEVREKREKSCSIHRFLDEVPKVTLLEWINKEEDSIGSKIYSMMC